MKSVKRIINNKYFPYIIIIALSTIICIPLFEMNMSQYNEARIHIGRIVSVKQIILDGVFPNFISSKHMMGFGYALNIFYGPLTTYIPILISWIIGSGIWSLKIFTLITVALSGIVMYNFVLELAIDAKENNANKEDKRNSSSKKYDIKQDEINIKDLNIAKLIALIASLIYIAAPYKLTDIYARTAVGEYTSFIFIPFVFRGLYKIINGKDKANTYIIIGAVGLILSHTITTIYVAIFAILYLIYNFNKIKNAKVIKSIIKDVLSILVLIAFYLIPLLEHKMYGDYTIFDSESMGATGEYVYCTSIGFKEWFSSEFSNNEFMLCFGLIITFAIILTPFVLKKAKKHPQYMEYILLAMLALFMESKLFPWRIMPNMLTIIQFAWRLNGFFIFFISYICAVNIMTIAKMIKDNKNAIAVITTMAIFACAWFGVLRYMPKTTHPDTIIKLYIPENYTPPNDKYLIDKKFESGIINSKIIGPYQINREYLPINAGKNISYIENREDKTYVINGLAIISNENKNGLKDTMNVMIMENATLELPYIYYHGYTVQLNGKNIKTYESENGFLCVDIYESGNISVEYTGTVLEKVGYVISGVGLIGILIYNKISKSKAK